MRTLLTLYNNVLNGLFPDHTAKPATTPTAKDGTPLKAINIDDLTIGWIQALFFQTGNATPNGNPELKDDSQIIDLMRQLFSTAEKQTINASGPVVFGPTNHEIEVDLSLGNVSIDQLPVPDFIGQKPHFYGVGSGIGDIAGGTGLYVNNVFFTENTGGVFLDAVSLTEFRAQNGVTADHVSGSVHVIQYANGIMQNIYSASLAATTLVANYYGSTSGNTYLGGLSDVPFPVAWGSPGPRVFAGGIGISHTEGVSKGVINSGDITFRLIRVSQVSDAATIFCCVRFEGVY